MIGKLRGTIDSFGDDFVIIDVQGVGYVVQCSSLTLQNLPRVGESASISIETQVREDAIRLFGFTTNSERDWFRLLQGVQGVGSKVALAILGVLPPKDLASAIAAQDKTMVSRAPGVGPKLAARIVAELKDKSPAFSAADLAGLAQSGAAADEATLSGKTIQDAVSALVNLGYGRPQAMAAIAASAKALGDDAEAGALIRRGLKELTS